MENIKTQAFSAPRPDDVGWQRAQSEARPAVRDVDASGIGQRRLQLIVCPSSDYDEGQAWEVRQHNDGWWLFRSELVESWPNVLLIGYQPIPIDPAILSSFFNRVAALSLRVDPCLADEGLDGEVMQLAVFSDFCSECRFQWWTGAAAHWKLLVELADEMLGVFVIATKSSA
jgi:hypothetical protein